ncbi:unnamed protein product, partial [Polarella glacialis]
AQEAGQRSRGAVPAAADRSSFTANVTGSLHLAKSIVGAGWLSLPAGVAALSGDVGEAQALPIALAMLLLFGGLAAASYREVAMAAKDTGSGTFAEAYSRSGAPGGASVAAWVCTLNCLGGCVSFAVLLGEASQGALTSWAGMEVPSDLQLPVRLATVAAVVFGLLWPLCAKLDFRSMGWTSGVGTAATIGAVMAMVYRLADGSYVSPEMGSLDAVAATQVAVGQVGSRGSGLVVLAALLANGFTAHHCAPQLQQAVCQADKTNSNAEPANFDVVIAGGFTLSAALYAVIMISGYLTFGHGCRGNILDSYLPSDSLAVAARLATLASVVCSFPAMLMGLRDSAADLFGQGAPKAPPGGVSSNGASWLEGSNVRELALVTLLAGLCTDLAASAAAQGAVLGCLLVYALPLLMAIQRRADGRASCEQQRVHLCR